MAEVVKMIKVREALEPVEYRKLSKRGIVEALSSFIFFKAKNLLPDEEFENHTEDHEDHEMDDPTTDAGCVRKIRRGVNASIRRLNSEEDGSAGVIGRKKAKY